MYLTKIMWIVCGVIYALLFLGVIGMVIFTRIKNRKRKDND